MSLHNSVVFKLFMFVRCPSATLVKNLFLEKYWGGGDLTPFALPSYTCAFRNWVRIIHFLHKTSYGDRSR